MKHEFNEMFTNCDSKGNSYRMYLVDDIWLILEQRNAFGTFLTGFLTKEEATDYLYELGVDIDELRPPDRFAEHW